MKPKLISVTASELVILAIHELESMKLHHLGPTSKDILEVILNKYKVNSDELKADIREALLRGVTFGILLETDGRYRLEDVPEPPLEMNPSEESLDNEQATWDMTVPSKSTRKRKKEDCYELGRKSVLKGKKNCKGCGKETKRSRVKSESEPEGNETDVEEEDSF